MSDDSFVREVDEELRQDQFKALWGRYGRWLIAAAVMVVLGTAAWRGYEYWTQSQADASGDQFLGALNLANEGKNDEALTSLETLEANGFGAYPVLARMRGATVLAQKGDFDAAVKAFDEVSKDKNVPLAIREMAALRAAFLLVDHGTYDDVAARAEVIAGDANQLRHSAREALGLAAWKAGNNENALKLFEQIEADAIAPADLRNRARIMAELIRGTSPAT